MNHQEPPKTKDIGQRLGNGKATIGQRVKRCPICGSSCCAARNEAAWIVAKWVTTHDYLWCKTSDLVNEFAAALDAKDAEIERFSSAITRIRSVVGETSNMLESDVRLLVNERDDLKLKLALAEAQWKEDLEQARVDKHERDTLTKQLEEAVFHMKCLVPQLRDEVFPAEAAVCGAAAFLYRYDSKIRPDIAKILEKQKGGVK